MSSYFSSNHTTSRFLANNAQSNPSSTNNPSTPGGASSHPAAAAAATAAARSRLPASKHFSTSVNPSTLERSNSKDLQSPGAISALAPSAMATTPTTTVHPLRNTWVFYYRQQRTPGNKIVNYEEGIKKISAFSSVESFWSLWTHLATPADLQPTTDYLLFHSGIRRPVWEDPINITGGKWIIRLRKGVANRLWEDLVLAIIGDQFDECKAAPQYLAAARTGSKSNNGGNNNGNGSGDGNGGGSGAGSGDEEGSGTEWPEICGCTISVRQNEDIISLWNRCEADYKVREKIRETMKRALNLPASTVMEYKTNNDSMQDRSSFRTTTTTTHDRTPH